jgi:hypothetical protein
MMNKEVRVAWSKYYSRIFNEGLREKPLKDLAQ